METFGGPILHSSVYHNPTPFAGKRVLVVGYGNSGGEIALDLSEASVDVALAVRSPVNVIPRELFGLPILAWGLTGRLFASRVGRHDQRAPASICDRLDRGAWLETLPQGASPVH